MTPTITTIYRAENLPKRTSTVGVVIHSTNGPNPRKQRLLELVDTARWFGDLANPCSHSLAGCWQVVHVVRSDREAGHALYLNATHLGLEIANPGGAQGYTDAEYEPAAWIVARWCRWYRIPVEHVLTETARGLIGHSESEQGQASGKIDPGPAFDWGHYIARVGHYFNGGV